MPPVPALVFPEASRPDAIAAVRQHVAEHLDERTADLGAVCYHAEFPTTVKRNR